MGVVMMVGIVVSNSILIVLNSPPDWWRKAELVREAVSLALPGASARRC